METINLSVNGMTCGACVRHVEKAIASVGGVEQVEVDLVLGFAKVKGNVSQKVAQIIAALEEEGYSAKVSLSEVNKVGSGSCSSGSGCCCH